jgi:hypothetical protein
LVKKGEEVFEVFRKPLFAGQQPPYYGRWVGVITADGMGFYGCYHCIETKKQEYRNFGSSAAAMNWIRARWEDEGGKC